MSKRRYYTIGYNGEIHLRGVDDEPWQITLEEAKERRRQLNAVIAEYEETTE